MKRKLVILTCMFVLLWTSITVTAGGPAAEVMDTYNLICDILDAIYTVLYLIAAGIGVVVLTLQGIKWTSSADDPGARKQAKQGIIHVIVGLIIVLIAIQIVDLVFANQLCVFGP